MIMSLDCLLLLIGLLYRVPHKGHH